MMPKLNELNVTQYDKHWGKRCVDWVTESTYYSEKSLTKDEFNEIVSKRHEICGELTYKKFKQTYSSGKIIYKHVLQEVMY